MNPKYPILIAVAHASTFVPEELRKLMQIPEFEIRQHSDLYTDEIFHIPKAHTVTAKISRLVTDPNRAPDDIEMEYKLSHEGVVVSISENGNPIYKHPPEMDAIFERVKKYHDTFHAEIDRLAPHMKFLIDGHSMRSIGPATKPDAGKKRSDIILGNRHYTTCSREMTLKIMEFFENKGLSVKINDPYEGNYVLGYHCSRKTLPGIQIEVNRKLYMNEKSLHPRKKEIQQLNGFMKELVRIINEEIEKQSHVSKHQIPLTF